MTGSGKNIWPITRVAGGKGDRVYQEPFDDFQYPFAEALAKAGKTQEDLIAAIIRARDEEVDFYGETGSAIEICETCCDAHLQIIFQRKTKVVAKGKKSEEWYATVGTMTVRKLTKLKREAGFDFASMSRPSHSAEELLTSDYVEPGYREPADNDFDDRYAEKGVPGTGRSNRKGTGEKNMVRAATHGLAACSGNKHATYGHKNRVFAGNYKYRALNIMATDMPSHKLMGQRSGVNIHVSSNWTWTEACFLPVPKGGIKYEPLNDGERSKHNKALGLPDENKGEYWGTLPHWSGHSTLELLNQLVKIVEDFAEETNQLGSKGRLPIGKLLKCVEVIIREPSGGYEYIYMNDKKSGLYRKE